MSRVSTRETLYRSSPPNARRSNRRAIFSLPIVLALFPEAHAFMVCAQLVIMRCWPSPLQRSAKPSDDKIKNRGPRIEGSSSRRCVTSGWAVIYGGVWLRTRNSSHGEVLWNPGKRLYSIRRVNSGGCLKGISPRPKNVCVKNVHFVSEIQHTSEWCEGAKNASV